MTLKTGMRMALGFLRMGDDLFIEAVAYMPGEQNFELEAGSLLDIKLGNDSILHLPSNLAVKPVTTVNGGSTYRTVNTTYLTKYILTAEQAMKIKQLGIKYARMHLQADKAYDLDFKEKDFDRSISAANCVYY